MSKEWYPVIDTEECIDCGQCVEFCPNGVYEKGTSTPVVVNPDNCGYGCSGCGNMCPMGAISYFGDNGMIENSCGCGDSCLDKEGKALDCGCGCGTKCE